MKCPYSSKCPFFVPPDAALLFPVITLASHFPLPPPSNNSENQNFEEMKKTPGDIILQMCTINDNHMMYGSEIWSAAGWIFCHFGPFFALLPH